jgi:hypothetical protein
MPLPDIIRQKHIDIDTLSDAQVGTTVPSVNRQRFSLANVEVDRRRGNQARMMGYGGRKQQDDEYNDINSEKNSRKDNSYSLGSKLPKHDEEDFQSVRSDRLSITGGPQKLESIMMVSDGRRLSVRPPIGSLLNPNIPFIKPKKKEPEKDWSRGALYQYSSQEARVLDREVKDILQTPPRTPPPRLMAIKEQREIEKMTRRIEANSRRFSEDPHRRESIMRRESSIRRRDSFRRLSIDRGNLETQLELINDNEEFSSTSKHRWKFALSYVVKLIRATRVFRTNQAVESSLNMPNYEPSDFDEAQGLTYMLKAHQSKADIVFSSKVCY